MERQYTKRRYMVLQSGTRYKRFDGRTCVLAVINPGENLNFQPGYRKGHLDTVWITFRGRLDTCSRKQCEAVAGMKLLPLDGREVEV